MSNKTIGIVLIVVGILVIIVDVVLGFTGLSALGVGVGFGFKKIILAVAGLIVALIGFFIQMQRAAPPSK